MSSIASQLSFSRARNIVGGNLGSIPYQDATSSTIFIPIGSNTFVLTSNGSTATWTNPSTLSVGGSSAQVNTVIRTTSADHFLTFVDSNNASATAESIYTTSTLVVNPSTGNVGIATSAPTTRLDITGGLRVSGITTSTNSTNATTTNTGALQVAGGVGIGQDLRVGGTIFGNVNGSVTGNAGTVSTVIRATSADHFLTFVDSNNVSATAEAVYTTSTILVNPGTGSLSIGLSSVASARLTVGQTYTAATAAESFPFYVIGNYNVPDTSLKQVIRTTYSGNHTTGTQAFGINILALHSVGGVGGTTTNAYNYWSRMDNSTGATVTNAINYYAENGAGSGGPVNQYGLYVSNLTKGTSANYAVYTVGTTPSYFGGNVGIGVVTPTTKLDVSGGLQVTGITTITNTTISNSTNTGALQVAGGVGIGGALWVEDDIYIKGGGIEIRDETTSSIIIASLKRQGSTAVLELGRFDGIASSPAIDFHSSGGNIDFDSRIISVGGSTSTIGQARLDLQANQVYLSSTQTATSTQTGALRVVGGVGIGGNLYVGGEIIAEKLTIQLTTVTTTLIQTDDVIQTLNVTNATSTITGALQVAGGAGIGRDLYVGGTIFGSISGTVTGNAGTVSTVQRTTSADHFLTFVDSNNASATAESVYTTSSFVINPSTGNVGTKGNVLIENGALSAGTSRNPGLRLWSDNAFGGELHFGSGSQSTSWATALFGRSTDTVALRFGSYPVSSTQQNQFVELLTLLTNGNFGIGTVTPTTRLDVSGGLRVSGITTSTNSTNASSTTTGALVVAGGVGVGGNLHAGGDIFTRGTQVIPLKIEEFIATASQTTFTITGGYTVGTVQVFANGIQLGSGAVVASNGTTVVLNFARDAGDIIRVISGGSSSAINNIQSYSLAMSVAFGT